MGDSFVYDFEICPKRPFSSYFADNILFSWTTFECYYCLAIFVFTIQYCYAIIFWVSFNETFMLLLIFLAFCLPIDIITDRRTDRPKQYALSSSLGHKNGTYFLITLQWNFVSCLSAVYIVFLMRFLTELCYNKLACWISFGLIYIQTEHIVYKSNNIW